MSQRLLDKLTFGCILTVFFGSARLTNWREPDENTSKGRHLVTDKENCRLVLGLFGRPYLHDDGSPDHVVHSAVVEGFLDVQVEVVLVGADGAQQLGDVVGVQRAGLRGQTTGQVGVADVSHALRWWRFTQHVQRQ